MRSRDRYWPAERPNRARSRWSNWNGDRPARRGEIGNAQRLVGMIVDIRKRGGKRRRDRARPRQRRRVARNPGKALNGAARIDQRLFPAQAPALAAVRIEMKLHPAADREPLGDDLEILGL